MQIWLHEITYLKENCFAPIYSIQFKSVYKNIKGDFYEYAYTILYRI